MCCLTCGCLGFCKIATTGKAEHCFFPNKYDSIIASADAGCQYCAIASQACASLPLSLEEKPEILIRVFPDSPTEITTMGGLDDAVLEIFASKDESGEYTHRLGEEVPERPNTSISFDFLEECFTTCRRDHPRCRKPFATLPKRVIDVSVEPYKLIEPVAGTQGSYAALSYRWGGWDSFTTRDTFEGLKKVIPGEHLPPLFRDFITIARKLAINHIWVDSVCIIQDDEADWNAEAAKMADVFENASVVIAAASASNPKISFLRERAKPASPTVQLEVLGSDIRFLTRRKIQSGHHAHLRSIHKDLLDDRGWALQERLLARRCIAYSASELQWSCRTIRYCECRRSSWEEETVLFGSESTMDCQFQGWQDIVQEYTSRKLTMAKDTIPALAGLAKKFASRNGTTYMAGLWKENFGEDLVWRRVTSNGFSAPVQYLAPSFSWASLHCPISYQPTRSSYGGSRTYHTKLVKARFRNVDENHYATVVDGWIVVCGPLASATLSCSDPKDASAYRLMVGGHEYCSDAFFDYELQGHGCDFVIDNVLVAEQHHSINTKQAAITRLRRAISEAETSVQFTDVPIKLLSLYSLLPNVGADAYENFLVLGAGLSQDPTTYQRLGMGVGKLSRSRNRYNVSQVNQPFRWFSETSQSDQQTTPTYNIKQIRII